MTHQEFLDEPWDTIEWMIRIDDLFTADENRRGRG